MNVIFVFAPGGDAICNARFDAGNDSLRRNKRDIRYRKGDRTLAKAAVA